MLASEDGVKSLWQSLPSEKVVFTNEQMQARVLRFQAKHKRRDLVEYTSYAALFALVAYVHSFYSGWQNWVISGLVILGAIISMRNYYRLAGFKVVRTQTAGETLLESMRGGLIRQRDAASSAWRWYILPFVPALIFLTIFRWVEEGTTLTELTDARVLILLLTALMISFLAACVLWLFLKAAQYQRQLDHLERYAHE